MPRSSSSVARQTGLEVRDLPIASVCNSEYNPRKISDFGLRSIRQSIEHYGFVEPIIVNDRRGKEWGRRKIGLTVGGGEICLDPFAGSGSQMVAAERLDRRCFMIEIEPRWCDVIRERYTSISHADSGRKA